jgi:hypothetical protein
MLHPSSLAWRGITATQLPLYSAEEVAAPIELGALRSPRRGALRGRYARRMPIASQWSALLIVQVATQVL